MILCKECKNILDDKTNPAYRGMNAEDLRCKDCHKVWLKTLLDDAEYYRITDKRQLIITGKKYMGSAWLIEARFKLAGYKGFYVIIPLHKLVVFETGLLKK